MNHRHDAGLQGLGQLLGQAATSAAKSGIRCQFIILARKDELTPDFPPKDAKRGIPV